MTEISIEEKAKLYNFALELKKLAEKHKMIIKTLRVFEYSGEIDIYGYTSEQIDREKAKEKEKESEKIIEA